MSDYTCRPMIANLLYIYTFHFSTKASYKGVIVHHGIHSRAVGTIAFNSVMLQQISIQSSEYCARVFFLAETRRNDVGVTINVIWVAYPHNRIPVFHMFTALFWLLNPNFAHQRVCCIPEGEEINILNNND